MKILLINPSKYDAEGRLEKYRRGSMPPLNLLIAAGLIDERRATIRVVDEYLEDVPFDQDFDLVGISTTFTCTFPRVIDISRRFRERGIPVVLGGTHATCMAQEAAPHADSIVLCEAERNWPALVEDRAAGRPLKPFYGGDFADLENEPFHPPRYDLVDLSRYIRIGLFSPSNLFALETSRGCPMPCTFCSIGITHGKKPRFRSIAAVLEEV